MSQYDILRMLERNKDKWYTAREIAIKLKVNKETIDVNLTKLRISGLVDREIIYPIIRIKGQSHVSIYRYKE